MSDIFLGPGGEQINADSIRARLSQETQDRIDQIIRRESELGAYDADAVMELGRNAI
jgi:hypothetical protein